MRKLRIAMRDWDWLTPLLLGEVQPVDGYQIEVQRCAALADPWQGELDEFDAFECSLARHNRAVLAGDGRVVAAAFPVMQSFRQRCLIVSKASAVHDLGDLRGGRVGVTGWIDSGNTWTRALFLDAGVDLRDVTWIAGRLTAAHPEQDRLQGHGQPGWIEPAPAGAVLTEMLDRGELDAIMTPFMPPGFYSADAPWRPLFDDVRAVEMQYANRVGFVPGHHVLGFHATHLDDAAQAIQKALLTSRRLWQQRREKLAETSQWLSCDLLDQTRLPAGWDEPGLARQGQMFEEFSRQAQLQGINSKTASAAELFQVASPAS